MKKFKALFKKVVIFKLIPTLVVVYGLIVGLGAFNFAIGHESFSPENMLAAQNRMLITFFGALLTSMALIITLTANLYTPRLVKIFVNHRITLLGMGITLIANMVIIVANMASKEDPYFKTLAIISFVISCICVAGIIPYLYYVSQFIKPSFFLPVLAKQITNKFDDIRKEKRSAEYKASAFDDFEVLSNIAYTAAKRDDKYLIHKVLDHSYDIINDLIFNYEKERGTWRLSDPQFIAGMSQEARYYLEQEKEWPEAYLFGRLTKIINSLDTAHNDIVPIYCEKILETLDEAVDQRRENIIEIHLMVLNALFRKSVDLRDFERFQALSYSYRLAIELLITNPKQLAFSTNSFLHYGELAAKKKMHTSLETIYFDLGRILLYFAYEDELLAVQYLESYVVPHIHKDKYKQEDEHIYYRTMTKTYWEASARRNEKLAKVIYTHFIGNEEYFIKSTKELLGYDRDLHWEFNDRLLSFAHMSTQAEELAKKFCQKHNPNTLRKYQLS